MLLCDSQIISYMNFGAIVIDPFYPDRLNTDSYDVELGPFFWRVKKHPQRVPSYTDAHEMFELVDARVLTDGSPSPFPGIWLEPQERVLGHTVEVIGGVTAVDSYGDDVAVTTQMQATSTAGRHGITACHCAGWGDVGYANIWTLEISNLGPDRMYLPVGSIIAQISFAAVQPPTRTYTQRGGNYQSHVQQYDASAIRSAWTPESMLPKKLKVRDAWKSFTWSR